MSDASDKGAPHPDAPQKLEREIPRIERLFKFAAPHRVRANEIDAQGVVGAASWLDVLQTGRVEYLRNLGLLSLEGLGAPVQAVVRSASVDYLAPARFDDALLVRVRVSQLGHASCRFEYMVDNADTRIRHVMGATVHVCVSAAEFKSMAWPRVWTDRLGEFEGEDLQRVQAT
jgi:acyl-CoA thioester hydrolase